MKKLSFVLVAAGLVSLAACTKPADTTNTANATDTNAMAMDNGANEMGNTTENAMGTTNTTDNAMGGNAMGESNAMGNTTGNTSNAM